MGLLVMHATGNIGAVSDVEYTDSKTARLRVSVAADYRDKNPRSGEYEKQTQWVRCTFWGKRAEALGRILEKGMRVSVTGRPVVRGYTAKDGEARAELEIAFADLEIEASAPGNRGERRPDDRGGPKQGSAATGGGFDDFPADDFGDDEIPF